jgi:hypothetical protein
MNRLILDAGSEPATVAAIMDLHPKESIQAAMEKILKLLPLNPKDPCL